MTTTVSESPLIRSLRDFVRLDLLFILFQVVLRCYEILLVVLRHDAPVTYLSLFPWVVLTDAQFILAASGVLALLTVPVLMRFPVGGARLYYLLFVLIAVIQFALIQYFTAMLSPLGADLFGYSMSDITFTVTSSAGMKLTTFLPLVILAAVIFLQVRYGNRFVPGAMTARIFVGVSLAGLLASPFTAFHQKGFDSEAAFSLSVNKTAYFAGEAVRHLTKDPISTAEITEEYPLVRDFPYNDVLGPFLKPSPVKPNIVIIIAEGLGRDFVGRGARYGGFVPYLDSLSEQGLYWENFLSNSGQTFGVLPSLLGSLPFGEKGFNELEYKIPRHLSLLRLLKQNNYRVNFLYGGNKNFDKKDVFLEQEQADLILDETKFGDTYHKAAGDASGFTWGYPDGDVFRKAIELLADQRPGPRLDIYLTMSTHEPFIPPNKPFYLKKFNDMLAERQPSPAERTRLTTYKDIFASLLYFNDAVRYLITEYSRRPDFANTLIFITADHRIIPIPAGTRIDRYRVPLILISPLVKEPVTFSSVSSHLDVTPSILAYLKANNGLRLPVQAHWLGDGIDTAREFRNIHSTPFMRVKEEIADYLSDTLYLSGDQLFRLQPTMDLEPLQNTDALALMKGKLERFREINSYVIDKNKLYPQVPELMDDDITTEDLVAFRRIDSLGLDMDKLFMLAREKAFAKDIKEARLICRRILAAAPNYNDVRTLLGRTYAWNKDYETAKRMFRNVIERDESYVDAYTALADAELWGDSVAMSLSYAQKGLLMYPQNEDLHVRTVKAYLGMGDFIKAGAALKKLKLINPANPDIPVLTNRVANR